MTNRALVLAALADGPSTVTGALRSRDTDLMIAALRALGTGITEADSATTLHVVPGPIRGAHIDCGLAGTVMRFVPPLAALADADVQFDGDEQARTRPQATLLDGLRGLGVRVDGDRLPFTVHARGEVPGGTVTIDASGSSQFVSGLLLSAARFDAGVTVRHDGPPVPSLPHIDMTVAMLRRAGVTVEIAHRHGAPSEWTVKPGAVRAVDWVVEPDLSNATPFLAAAAVTGGEVTVPHWPAETTQAGDAIRAILTDMGADVRRTDAGLTVRGPGELLGLDVDLHDVGELAPTVTALAALATTPSTLRGIAHLRGHETDRLAALATEFAGLGGDVTETADGLEIRPSPLHGGPWRAYADHRMATAGAIVGLRVPGIEIDDVATTAKTLPGFDRMWETMLDSSAAHDGSHPEGARTE